MPTFGELISQKRKDANLSQRELAVRIIKEDGRPISPQYLNDLEHDRRNAPPEHLIEQFAVALNVEAEILYHCAGELPPDIRCTDADEKQVVAAYKAFRNTLRGDN